jgi:ABC-type uncharacterized transport system substrate-binding protein
VEEKKDKKQANPHQLLVSKWGPRNKKLLKSGWMFASGGLLMLMALAFWMNQLHQRTDKFKQETTKTHANGLVADGETQPGSLQKLWFKEERCIPWHVSAACEPPPLNTRFVVLTSRIIDPYGYITGGFSKACNAQAVLIIEDVQPEQIEKAMAKHKPAAVITIGQRATRYALENFPDTRLLFASVPETEAMVMHDKAAGISSWVPMQALVRHLALVLPETKKRLAVFHSQKMAASWIRTAVRMFAAQGRTLISYAIKNPAQLTGSLNRAIESADAVLVLPDGRALDAQAFNRIQMAAEEHRLPLCVPDEEHVRQGAFVGVGIDSHRIGEQLCHLAGAMLRGRIKKSTVYCPEYSFAVIHQAVVEKLGYLLDLEQLVQAKLYQWR